MLRRVLLLSLVVLSFSWSPSRMAAQDSSALLQQMNELVQQMQGANDPCPFMPRFKALMKQMAEQSPEILQAMKPVLDAMNQDDTCNTASQAVPPASQANVQQGLTPEQHSSARRNDSRRWRG